MNAVVKQTSKHTPGPWTYDVEYSPTSENPERRFFTIDANTIVVCQMVRDKADALLIATAPELLEALRVAADRLQDIADTLSRSGKVLWINELEQARAGIGDIKRLVVTGDGNAERGDERRTGHKELCGSTRRGDAVHGRLAVEGGGGEIERERTTF